MMELARSGGDAPTENEKGSAGKQREWLLFLFLTVVLAPALSVAFVGGYGFLVWMYQLVAGPPGPPAH